MSSNLQIVTGTTGPDSATQYITINSPALLLYSTASSSETVVEPLSETFIYSENLEYWEAIISFNLLSALLDSAPTQNANGVATTTLFTVTITSSKLGTSSYVIDAQIQTKGNSAMSPTYITKVSNNAITFPVTNFFNVSSPGAPYTLTITGTKQTNV